MTPSRQFSDSSGVAPVISVVLMVAITVILAAVIGTVVLDLGERAGSDTPNASFTCTPDGLTTHVAGDSIPVAELANVDAGQIEGDEMRASDSVATDSIVWQNGRESYVLFECDSYIDGVVHYWSLDDVGSGTAHDSVGGLDGTPENDVTGTVGAVHDAATFGGNDGDYVSLPADDSLNNITGGVTVAAWVYYGESGTDMKIFGTHDGRNSGGFKLSVYTTDKVEFEIRDASGSAELIRGVSGGTELETGRWYFVVGRYDGEKITTFVNGTVDREVQVTTSLGVARGESAIGQEPNAPFFGDYNSWNGKIDDVRIYDRALSEAEIRALYDRTR